MKRREGEKHAPSFIAENNIEWIFKNMNTCKSFFHKHLVFEEKLQEKNL